MPRPRNLVVDTHGHVKWFGYDADRLIDNMDEHGIDVMWLLTWECPPEHIDLNSYTGIAYPGQFQLPIHDVLEAAAKYPERLIPFYAPPPNRPFALQHLQSAVKYHGVRGCGEMKCRIMMDDPHALRMWHYCGEANLPVIFHMDIPLPPGRLDKDPGYWYCCAWENLARALALCPETIFLGHAPGFWREISGDAADSPDAYPTGPVTPGGRLWELLDAFPNLYCDLSAGSARNAISRDPAIGKEFLLKYQDRCCFARDCFDGALQAFLKKCNLPKSVYNKIMGGNARRLVPLDKH